jgi:hypothetical protein
MGWGFKMYGIDEIMEMLDWNNNLEVQQKGVELGGKIKTINAFILPMHSGCNKNVWENCAKILSKQTDKTLEPYLGQLLEWLEDLNWSGAEIILERLKKFLAVESLMFNLKHMVDLASATKNITWLINMAELLDNEELKKYSSNDTIKTLNEFYKKSND